MGDFCGLFVVKNDFFQLKLLSIFFTERQTILPRDSILKQREYSIRRDVQEPGECSDGVAAHADSGNIVVPLSRIVKWVLGDNR